MCWRQLQRVGTLYFETESFSLFLFCFGELGIQTLMGNGPFFFFGFEILHCFGLLSTLIPVFEV